MKARREWKKAREGVEVDQRKAKRPALEGRPPPDVPEVAASEAADAPLARPMEIAEEMSQRGPKRGEEFGDLYRSEAPDPGSTDEPVVVFQKGGSSGSGGANPVPEPMQEEPAHGDVQIAGKEESSVGLIEKIFHDHGVKCSRHEAESLSNLVASLGVDYKAETVLNDGLWLNMEEVGNFKRTRSSRRCSRHWKRVSFYFSQGYHPVERSSNFNVNRTNCRKFQETRLESK